MTNDFNLSNKIVKADSTLLLRLDILKANDVRAFIGMLEDKKISVLLNSNDKFFTEVIKLDDLIKLAGKDLL